MYSRFADKKYLLYAIPVLILISGFFFFVFPIFNWKNEKKEIRNPDELNILKATSSQDSEFTLSENYIASDMAAAVVSEEKNNSNEPTATSNELTSTGTVLRMLFVGDLMLDRHVGEKIRKYGLPHLFEKLPGKGKEFFSGCDIVGANLEGAVTDKGEHYPPNNSYDFAFSPDLIKRLQDFNFNFFNIANNHLLDQGEKGVKETRSNLEKIGYYFSGCADGTIGDCSSVIIEKQGLKIGLAGLSMVYKNFDPTEAAALIKELSGDTDVVIVNIHWGTEYEHQFFKKQSDVARLLAGSGADFIIGHHPHVVQGMELIETQRRTTNDSYRFATGTTNAGHANGTAHANNFKDVPVFYSLGNFIFDQYFSADTQEELAIQIMIDQASTTIEFLPLKSKSSQLMLMQGSEKENFLRKFAGWSKLSTREKDLLVKAGNLKLEFQKK